MKRNVGTEGKITVDEVQTFVRTAPATSEHQDGRDQGLRASFSFLSRFLCYDECADALSRPTDIASWYTNPQTEAFCAMLGIPNMINPVPAGFKEAQAAQKVLDEAAEATRKAQESSQSATASEKVEMEVVIGSDVVVITAVPAPE